jgi:hypothetical protein
MLYIAYSWKYSFEFFFLFVHCLRLGIYNINEIESILLNFDSYSQVIKNLKQTLAILLVTIIKKKLCFKLYFFMETVYNFI